MSFYLNILGMSSENTISIYIDFIIGAMGLFLLILLYRSFIKFEEIKTKSRDAKRRKEFVYEEEDYVYPLL